MKENKKHIIAGWKTDCVREKEARRRFAMGILEEAHSMDKKKPEQPHRS